MIEDMNAHTARQVKRIVDSAKEDLREETLKTLKLTERLTAEIHRLGFVDPPCDQEHDNEH